LSLFTSAQQVSKGFLNTNWVNDYSCARDGLILTLNSGCFYISAEEKMKRLYTVSVGLGLRMMALEDINAADGFAQKSFNELAGNSSLCFYDDTNSSKWNGDPLLGRGYYHELFQAGMFSVCSPCDSHMYCTGEKEFVVHANCLDGRKLSLKRDFLRSKGSWLLLDDWRQNLAQFQKTNLQTFVKLISSVSLD